MFQGVDRNLHVANYAKYSLILQSINLRKLLLEWLLVERYAVVGMSTELEFDKVKYIPLNRLSINRKRFLIAFLL